MHVAWSKAAAVGPTVPDGIVLAADSVGWIDNHVIGKPDDEAHARRIIKGLSGTTHELWTGVCLWLRSGDWHDYYARQYADRLATSSAAD